MSIKIKRINDVSVKKVRTSLDEDKRPIKGEKLFNELYSNIFLCARKMSGKSTVLYKIIKETCTPQTTVIAFASTLHKDDVWKSIVNMCKKRGIPFVGHTSIFEEGADQLQALVQLLETEAEDKDEEDEEESEDDDGCIQCDHSEDEEEKEKKPRKSKFQAPEYLIILDDLSSELKSKSLVALLKKNRHYKCKICISSQYLNDLLPESRKQLDYMLAFKGQSKKKLEEIHRDCDIGVDLSDFIEIYHTATMNEPHNFLYIDTRKNMFRINFSKSIEIFDN